MPDDPRALRRPGTRAGLNKDAIVAAARTVYDRGGLPGLTMRAVSRELAVAPNALYSHVRSKDELVDAVIDGILGEIEIPDEDLEWRDALRKLMVGSRPVLLKHGSMMQEFQSRATRGENALRLGESTLRILARAGIHGEAAVTALRVLLVYTIGFIAQEIPRVADPDGVRRKQQSEDAYRGSEMRPLSRALATELSAHPDSRVFETGLDWLLDGIADLASLRIGINITRPSS